MGKIGPTEPRGVEGMFQHSRCASRERRESKVQKKLHEYRDAISLVFLSAVPRENSSSFRSTLHNLRHIMFFNVWNWSLPRSEGQVQNWVRRRSYLLESLRSPLIEHLRSITTSHEKWQKIQYYAENFVFLVVQGFKDSFFMVYLTDVSEFVFAGTMNILFCVQQQYEVRIRVNKHKETCYKPSHRTTNKHGETRHRLNCHEERCNRKRSHTHFLKDRNCEMQEGQNYSDSLQEAHRWSHTSSSKIWENWKQQSTKSKLRLCESGNHHRYAIVGQNLAA